MCVNLLLSTFDNVGKMLTKKISVFIEPSIFSFTKQCFTVRVELQKVVNLYHISHIDLSDFNM